MANMLSRARFNDEDDMVSDDEEVGEDFFESTNMTTWAKGTPALNKFNESEYDGEWLQIGRFLQTLTLGTAWMREEAHRIRKKAYRDGSIWRHPKKRGDIGLRVVVKKEEQDAQLMAYHESPWSGHHGTWATFEKLKEKYCWPRLYQDVHQFMTTCENCQLPSTIRHRDELHPTYPPTIHFKWMVDLVTMPMGVE